ncbi:MAG: histidine kinase, partial [Nitrosopumilaceae archaeon]|nr:histidine kinase [Nitrosopumilaceae archaeon]NIX61252.1 histidine kinase [Nitrosopumilaceae archaeon]
LPGVYVDESQIEQVLLNLMLNAFEALDTGGTIQVSSYKKRLNLLGEEERDAVSAQEYYYVLVEISDNGPGIEPEKLSKIFNPFFTTKSHRLGLGLSICSRLIEENRGKIDVISKVDKGSNFILSLPTFAYHQPHVS